MEYMSRSVQRLGGLPRGTKRFLMVAHDFFALTLAAALLPWLLGAPARTLLVNPDHLLFFAIYVPGGLVILWRLHFYRMVLRRLDQSVVQQIVWAGLALSGLAAAIYLERTIPVKAVVLGLVIGGLSVVLLGFGRALMRAALSDIAVGGGEGAPLIIYGAGRAGHHLAATLANDERFRPVAFLDDDPALQSLRVGALTVHPSKDIDALRRRFSVTRVALAIPSLGRRRRREITDRLNAAGFEVLSIPTFADLVSGSHAVSDLRKVDVDELLGRDVVDLSQSRLHRWFQGRTVLVTGAGGSIGAEVARQILQLGPARLILFDISEVALYEIDQELSAQADRTEIVPILGSVTDRARLDAVFAAQKIDAVFHAAAYKHVPLVEANTLAGIANNVIGTEEVAQAA
ncbi:MAG: SDR family NAD(P)-dependent oxidoreductase, partial [Pseudomonadota bacterium]